MNRIKTIHIHTDPKFTGVSWVFESNYFDNKIIILGSNKSDYHGPYKEISMFFKQNRRDFLNIINLCKTADVVVLYGLNFPKCYIANRLPKSVKVIWRFFGAELYNKMPEYVYSTLTIKAKKSRLRSDSVYRKISNSIDRIKLYLRYLTDASNEFNNALKRVDFFLGLSELEYQFLKRYWPCLPQYIQLPFKKFTHESNTAKTKSNYIIVGNNRNAYNNHLDIISIIENTKPQQSYSFILLFNYGDDIVYANQIRKKAQEINGIMIVEDFLPLDKFKYLYSTASAFVMNGHRQMAMGNIFEALRNDVKIYLNEKNIILGWLKEEGFLIFAIKDFISDLETNCINLSEKEARCNRQQLDKFTKKYNSENFHGTLQKIFSLKSMPSSVNNP